jgi:hypothetical protein
MELFGASFSYKRRIYNKWFIGGNLGVGLATTTIHFTLKQNAPSGFDNKANETFLETSHVQLSLGYLIKNYVVVEFGPRLSTFWPGPEAESIYRISLSNSLYVRIKHVHLGIRLMILSSKYDFFEFFEESYSNSLIILRIPLKKW